MATKRQQLARTATLLAFTLAGTFLGTAAARNWQARTQQESVDLPSLVRERSQQVQDSRRAVDVLQEEVTKLSVQAGDDQARKLQRQGSALKALAAQDDLRGPGIQVTLQDAPANRSLSEGISPDDLVVHQQDMEAVINALWAGGAQGISVMDQRLVPTGAVRCVGNTLRFRGRVYSPPYTVKAVGAPKQLLESLEKSPEIQTYRQYVRRFGLGYEVQELESVKLPGQLSVQPMKHASASK